MKQKPTTSCSWFRALRQAGFVDIRIQSLDGEAPHLMNGMFEDVTVG